MVLGSLKPKPLAGFVFRGRLGMFEYFRSLNLVDKFAHTSVNSAPSKRESSLSKFHFSDIGRFAGRQQTSTIQANVIITKAGYISFGHNDDSLASVGVWATSETQNRRYPRPDQPSCGCSRWNDRWTTWAKEKKKNTKICHRTQK
ncbi:Bradyzoite-formation deficient protein [Trichinella spiralis]|uniref:Bradyzoite-formation deficient protein n=1 Tax=Trichinella spiralis TaxID=6334 RepID=A0ABR3KRY0_TRISP